MLDWKRMPVSSAQTARLLPWPRVRARRVGRPSSRSEWRERLGQLIDAMDRSVDPPAWWRRGQPMQLAMAEDEKQVVVQEDIASGAAEIAGDEPAVAGGGAGNGGGDDEPAEPCTKRRKTHEGVVLLFCPRQARLDHGAVSPLRKKGTPIFLRARAHRHTRKMIVQKTSGTALGRPRSLEPAAVLADIVSRVCSRMCCGAGVLAELLNSHLDTVGVQYRFSTRHSRKFLRPLGYSKGQT